MVDGSIAIVLDNSIASGNSEEALIISVEWLHLLGLNGEFGCNLIFIMIINEFVKYYGFLDLSIFKEEVEG